MLRCLSFCPSSLPHHRLPPPTPRQWSLVYALINPVASPLFLLYTVRDIVPIDYPVFGFAAYQARTARGLPADCLRTASGLPTDYLRTTFGLPADCPRTFGGLPADCMRIVRGLARHPHLPLLIACMPTI